MIKGNSKNILLRNIHVTWKNKAFDRSQGMEFGAMATQQIVIQPHALLP